MEKKRKKRATGGKNNVSFEENGTYADATTNEIPSVVLTRKNMWRICGKCASTESSEAKEILASFVFLSNAPDISIRRRLETFFERGNADVPPRALEQLFETLREAVTNEEIPYRERLSALKDAALLYSLSDESRPAIERAYFSMALSMIPSEPDRGGGFVVSAAELLFSGEDDLSGFTLRASSYPFAVVDGTLAAMRSMKRPHCIDKLFEVLPALAELGNPYHARSLANALRETPCVVSAKNRSLLDRLVLLAEADVSGELAGAALESPFVDPSVKPRFAHILTTVPNAGFLASSALSEGGSGEEDACWRNISTGIVASECSVILSNETSSPSEIFSAVSLLAKSTGTGCRDENPLRLALKFAETAVGRAETNFRSAALFEESLASVIASAVLHMEAASEFDGLYRECANFVAKHGDARSVGMILPETARRMPGFAKGVFEAFLEKVAFETDCVEEISDLVATVVSELPVSFAISVKDMFERAARFLVESDVKGVVLSKALVNWKKFDFEDIDDMLSCHFLTASALVETDPRTGRASTCPSIVRNASHRLTAKGVADGLRALSALPEHEIKIDALAVAAGRADSEGVLRIAEILSDRMFFSKTPMFSDGETERMCKKELFDAFHRVLDDASPENSVRKDVANVIAVLADGATPGAFEHDGARSIFHISAYDPPDIAEKAKLVAKLAGALATSRMSAAVGPSGQNATSGITIPESPAKKYWMDGSVVVSSNMSAPLLRKYFELTEGKKLVFFGAGFLKTDEKLLGACRTSGIKTVDGISPASVDSSIERLVEKIAENPLPMSSIGFSALAAAVRAISSESMDAAENEYAQNRKDAAGRFIAYTSSAIWGKIREWILKASAADPSLAVTNAAIRACPEEYAGDTLDLVRNGILNISRRRGRAVENGGFMCSVAEFVDATVERTARSPSIAGKLDFAQLFEAISTVDPGMNSVAAVVNLLPPGGAGALVERCAAPLRPDDEERSARKIADERAVVAARAGTRIGDADPLVMKTAAEVVVRSSTPAPLSSAACGWSDEAAVRKTAAALVSGALLGKFGEQEALEVVAVGRVSAQAFGEAAELTAVSGRTFRGSNNLLFEMLGNVLPGYVSRVVDVLGLYAGEGLWASGLSSSSMGSRNSELTESFFRTCAAAATTGAMNTSDVSRLIGMCAGVFGENEESPVALAWREFASVAAAIFASESVAGESPSSDFADEPSL